jgi:hypothetical protein
MQPIGKDSASESSGTHRLSRDRSSSFIHSTESIQEAGASLSIGDEVDRSDFEDVVVASVFADNEIERSRMALERDHFHHYSDGSARDIGVGEQSDGHAFSTSPRGQSVFPDNSGGRAKSQATAKRSKNRSRQKPKKLDLTSMLDRCGGDLELLNGVLERYLMIFYFIPFCIIRS